LDSSILPTDEVLLRVNTSPLLITWQSLSTTSSGLMR